MKKFTEITDRAIDIVAQSHLYSHNDCEEIKMYKHVRNDQDFLEHMIALYTQKLKEDLPPRVAGRFSDALQQLEAMEEEYLKSH